MEIKAEELAVRSYQLPINGTLDSIQRNNSTKTAWVIDGHHIATVRHLDVHNLFTLLIFGMTTGLFAAVLGKDIFSVPYCGKGKE